MNNQIAIRYDNNDLIPKNLPIVDLADFSIQLKQREIEQFKATYSMEFYEMSAEFIWSRAIALLKDNILTLGEDFVFEMLGRTDGGSAEEIPTHDVIYLAAELGFINNTAKAKLLSANQLIMHYKGRDAEEEMDNTVADLIIKSAIQSILCREKESVGIEYNNFRTTLKQQTLENTGLLEMLINSPYFYKRTTTKTLINLLKQTQDAELDIVSANMLLILPLIWSELLSDDRYPIGIAYAEAVNNGKKTISRVLKSVLLKVQGFDYVPENLRSSTFINVSSKLISTHYGEDNFYHEPTVIKELASLGSIIPAPAIGSVVSAILHVKLGNYYGISYDAQDVANKILEDLSQDKWKYYFDRVFIGKGQLIYKLQDSNIIPRWIDLVTSFGLHHIDFDNSNVTKLLIATKNKNASQIRSISASMLKLIDN